MPHPLISIIIPVYNAGKYLKPCIESILSQDYPNVEIWCIDDHSTDSSAATLNDYTTNHKNISYRRNEGKGIVPALQLGLSLSSGAYIHRMDADDLMPPQKLTQLYNTLNLTNEPAISVGCVSYFSDEGAVQGGYKRYADWINTNLQTEQPYNALFKECIIPSCAWLMKTEHVKSLGLFENLQYPEDYDFCFRLYREKIPIIATKEVVHLWRDHPARTSRNSEVYRDNRFFELKVQWYKKLLFQHSKTVIVWGAGRNGKHLVKCMKDASLEVLWISNNPNKIEKDIYGVKIQSPESLSNDTVGDAWVAMGSESDQNEAISYLSHFPTINPMRCM